MPTKALAGAARVLILTSLLIALAATIGLPGRSEDPSAKAAAQPPPTFAERIAPPPGLRPFLPKSPARLNPPGH